MITFRKFVAAACLLAGIGMAAASSTLAADLPAGGGAEATQYQFQDRTRRGVLVREGILLVRADGCYFSNVEIINGNSYPVSVTISYRWQGRYGRPLVSIPALHAASLAPGELLVVDGEGCGRGVGAHYPTLARTTPARIVSVR